MKYFLGDDFLLSTPTAVQLYKNTAKEMPIFDFHCHLDPKEIFENKHYENLTQLWLAGDHYKWRTMRMNGIGEHFITGEASDWEKFFAWSQTVPYLIGNPLYHWTHMELKSFFDIDKRLSPDTALEIWEECNKKLQDMEFTPQSFIKKSNVQFIGTTDDPISTLEYHQLLNHDSTFKTKVVPTFRPDGALFIERPTFQDWLKNLEQVVHQRVTSIAELIKGLQYRVDFFHENGGRAADHDIPYMEYKEVTLAEAETIFTKRMNGESLSQEELIKYRSFLLKELGKMYAQKQWVMQLHIGAMRNNNTKMKNLLGSDTGFDSIGEANIARGLSHLLDALDQEDALPRVVLFNLNPKDNLVLASMMGNFYEEGVPGKVQLGTAWWFNDHIDGIEKQMKDLANVGLLSHFIGMLTDSRSFLSYERHDYFRRILCNLIGKWVEQGRVPNDNVLLQTLIENISYYNAEKYFLQR
ncbi:Uronate isomerase [Peribacillus sp. Bi96]|uniref:glucuronate isomerase n=1 Tax=Peribacillus sp. Bi96 TaxID=2884273 RepID=UPI001DADF416|nr:glucuronate isomerase [Peribacillus sp. Bi96]CAH0267782.1 Uronate isomerase [Peribacillus sp. Bi96]